MPLYLHFIYESQSVERGMLPFWTWQLSNFVICKHSVIVAIQALNGEIISLLPHT